MIYYLVVIAGGGNSVLASMKRGKGQQYEPLDRGNTYSLRGWAMIFIILAHCAGNVGDPLVTFIGKSAAYCTGIFLFLSGYFNYISISTKHSVCSICKWLGHKVWGIYSVVIYTFPILLFLISFVDYEEIDFLRATIYSFLSLTLPLTKLWYIRAQISLYLLLAIARVISKRNENLLLVLFVVAEVYILRKCGMPSYWWNTLLCFCLGGVVAKYRDQMHKFFVGSFKKWVMVLAGIGIELLCLNLWSRGNTQHNVLLYLSGALFVYILSYRVSFKNKLCMWIGKNSLYFFIIHVVLAQLLFRNTKLEINVFVILVFCGTCALTYFCNLLVNLKSIVRTK